MLEDLLSYLRGCNSLRFERTFWLRLLCLSAKATQELFLNMVGKDGDEDSEVSVPGSGQINCCAVSHVDDVVDIKEEVFEFPT